MKKIFFLLFCMPFSFIFGQNAGIFESYAILNMNGSGNTYYDLQANTTNPDFQGSNLGTFTNAQSLVLVGGEIKTFKNSGGDVTGGKISYRVYSGTPSGTFSELNFGWLADLGNGDQKWGATSGTTNLLSGLSPGTYTLEIFSEASTNVGTKFSNNGGANYLATFTITSTLSTKALDKEKAIFVADGKLYTSQKGKLQIQILDYSGRLIKNMQVMSTSTGIDLSLPRKGKYILVVNNKAFKITN